MLTTDLRQPMPEFVATEASSILTITRRSFKKFLYVGIKSQNLLLGHLQNI